MAKAITIIRHNTEEELEKEIKMTRDGRYILQINGLLKFKTR
jgi:hypothetical protein